jgi:RHS repeat-associated protein
MLGSQEVHSQRNKVQPSPPLTPTATASFRKDAEYPLFDGLGSERTVTNSSQTVTGTIIQDGFGLTVATTGSSTNPYKFAATSGYRDDGDCGLTHVGARYYDAQVGRFVTRDTVLSQKAYLYCEHDPVNNVDPDGHRVPKWLAVILVGWQIGGSKIPPDDGSVTSGAGEIVREITPGVERKRKPGDGGGGPDPDTDTKRNWIIGIGVVVIIGIIVAPEITLPALGIAARLAPAGI